MSKHLREETSVEKLEDYMRFQVKHFLSEIKTKRAINDAQSRQNNNRKFPLNDVAAEWYVVNKTLTEIETLAQETFEDWL